MNLYVLGGVKGNLDLDARRRFDERLFFGEQKAQISASGSENMAWIGLQQTSVQPAGAWTT